MKAQHLHFVCKPPPLPPDLTQAAKMPKVRRNDACYTRALAAAAAAALPPIP